MYHHMDQIMYISLQDAHWNLVLKSKLLLYFSYGNFIKN